MGEPFAANVTSGVAIVEAKKEIAVYFGCIVSPARGRFPFLKFFDSLDWLES